MKTITEDGTYLCPEHGNTLGYAEDQGDEYTIHEHLECTADGCTYDVWAY